MSGETSKQGIITEIKEELGIDADINGIQLFKTIKTEDDFVDLYYLKQNIDIKDIKLQKEEVDDVAWNSIQEIKNKINNNEFSESHTEFFNNCLEFLKNK